MLKDDVPTEVYEVPIGQARVMKEGTDITIVSMSYMSIEALRAAQQLAEEGIDAEVIDLRSIRPLDTDTVINSVSKTGRLLVVDQGWGMYGVGSEIVATVAEKIGHKLKSNVGRLALPETPTPTSWALTNHYYTSVSDIANKVRVAMGVASVEDDRDLSVPQDKPDNSFTGPF